MAFELALSFLDSVFLVSDSVFLVLNLTLLVSDLEFLFSDSVFWFEATTGSGFGAALFGRDEPGDNGVAAFRGGVLLTMLCRVQFRCLAGLSAQAST